MPVSFAWTTEAALYSLCVLFRISGIFVMVPIPGLRLVPTPIRVCCALLLSLALLPTQPAQELQKQSAGSLLLIVVSEMGLGLMAGVIAGFLGDLMLLAVQFFSLQAGFNYASAIDPNSDADSNVLQSFAQLASTLIFFQTGMHAALLKALARSLIAWPPGTFHHSSSTAATLVSFGGSVFELAMRLALPFVGLLLITDLTLALLGRLNSQLQLLALAFPVKMLGTLVLFAGLSAVVPGVYRRGASQAMALLARLVP